MYFFLIANFVDKYRQKYRNAGIQIELALDLNVDMEVY